MGRKKTPGTGATPEGTIEIHFSTDRKLYYISKYAKLDPRNPMSRAKWREIDIANTLARAKEKFPTAIVTDAARRAGEVTG